MNTKNILKIVCTTLLLLLAFSMAVNSGLSSLVNASPTAASAKIWTDKADYHPGTVVTIYGAGFKPNSEVTLVVTKVKDGSTTTIHATSSSQGGFTTTYQIDKQGAPLYKIVATDGVSNAKTTFTDSSPFSAVVTPGRVLSLGGSQTFSVTIAGGSGSPSYQWYVDGNQVPTATTSTYTYTAPQNVGGHSIYVAVTEDLESNGYPYPFTVYA